ncbi:Rid family hydrolase [Flammeovirgaceae bacterium SG7u.111]|nr:Rid family hydrolase [Flammeovirgaceae bacterium SG7u.132]WPO33579.1 Rid family hydrolase [Flammeovirgaceae bacterium SG7u.111]
MKNVTKIKKFSLLAVALFLFAHHLSAQVAVMKGSSKSIISSTADIPAGSRLVYTSGMTASAIKADLEDGEYEKYGDTEAQAMSVLSKLEEKLKEEGLSFKDVFSMKVFVAPDTKTGEYDFAGWNRAYKKHFGTEENPTKPVRATVGVATLVSKHKFIEVEVIAAGK